MFLLSETFCFHSAMSKSLKILLPSRKPFLTTVSGREVPEGMPRNATWHLEVKGSCCFTQSNAEARLVFNALHSPVEHQVATLTCLHNVSDLLQCFLDYWCLAIQAHNSFAIAFLKSYLDAIPTFHFQVLGFLSSEFQEILKGFLGLYLLAAMFFS